MGADEGGAREATSPAITLLTPEEAAKLLRLSLSWLAKGLELDVLLEPGGRVTAVEIHMSSSHGVLDEAGIAAVRSLPPLPLPEGLPRRPLRIRLPLDFQLR